MFYRRLLARFSKTKKRTLMLKIESNYQITVLEMPKLLAYAERGKLTEYQILIAVFVGYKGIIKNK